MYWSLSKIFKNVTNRTQIPHFIIWHLTMVPLSAVFWFTSFLGIFCTLKNTLRHPRSWADWCNSSLTYFCSTKWSVSLWLSILGPLLSIIHIWTQLKMRNIKEYSVMWRPRANSWSCPPITGLDWHRDYSGINACKHSVQQWANPTAEAMITVTTQSSKPNQTHFQTQVSYSESQLHADELYIVVL